MTENTSERVRERKRVREREREIERKKKYGEEGEIWKAERGR